MSASSFVVATLRLAAIVVPVLLAAHLLRRRYVQIGGALGALVEFVLAASFLLVGAEALGAVSELRLWPLIGWGLLLAVITALPRTAGGQSAGGAAGGGVARRGLTPSAFLAVAVVAAQWGVQTANALGGGMLSFDTLWYHMPFAARFAQTGSVTALHFTQADPLTAYFPANSELVHAVGIVAMRSDFLSPLLNLLWLALALLAAWCVGRPWALERQTFTAGCLAMALPVLSLTQPGTAFNDAAGLAMLLAAVALIVNAEGRGWLIATAGLALGFAVGTKVTFIVPAVVLLVGVPLVARPARRLWTAAALVAPLVLTGAFWYVRNLLDVGNPFGLRVHLGPLLLPGPASPIANASQQTVISELRHVSLWGSRFAPGLAHALGPLWPLLLAMCVAAVLAGIARVGDRTVRVLAWMAGAAGVTYLLLPTGATSIEQGTSLFEANLRYATPALAVAILLVPVVVRLRLPRAGARVGPALLALLLVTQFEHALWPRQSLRHLAFVAAAAAAIALVLRAHGWVRRPRPVAALAVGALALGAGGAAFAAQRHYFDRRYRVAVSGQPGLTGLYRWAQAITGARIALYGTVEQYPLYGARDTNRVDYLGERTLGGGFEPIMSCRLWRQTIARGRFGYLVLTPGPTAPVPAPWTMDDPAAVLVLHPSASYFVFRLRGAMAPGLCR